MTDFKRKTPQQRANHLDAVLAREHQSGVSLLAVVVVPDDGSDPVEPKSQLTCRWIGFESDVQVAELLRDLLASLDPAGLTERGKQ